LSNRGSAVIDPATNTLIIKDNQNVIKEFERLIEQLDVPARQVMIEARIVEANDGFSRALGVKFGYNRTSGSTRIGSGLGSGGGANGNTFSIVPNVNLPAASATSSITIVRALSSGALGLELTAMQEQNGQLIVVQMGDENPKYPVVTDGVIQVEILETIGRSEEWLLDNLSKQGYDNVANIFIAEYDKGVVSVVTYE